MELSSCRLLIGLTTTWALFQSFVFHPNLELFTEKCRSASSNWNKSASVSVSKLPDDLTAWITSNIGTASLSDNPVEQPSLGHVIGH